MIVLTLTAHKIYVFSYIEIHFEISASVEILQLSPLN